MPDHNLNYTDKMAMQAGVEVRVPLVDHRLVASLMQLPLSAKISLRETKRILRASQRDRLPAQILTRAKQGFGVPVRSWLQGPARDLMEDLTSPATLYARGLFDSDAVALKVPPLTVPECDGEGCEVDFFVDFEYKNIFRTCC